MVLSDRNSPKVQNWAPQTSDMEQQARVAFLWSQAQFLLYVFNKTELHQSQAWFVMEYDKKDKNKENKEKKIIFIWNTPPPFLH